MGYNTVDDDEEQAQQNDASNLPEEQEEHHKPRRAQYLSSLQFLRFLATVHVVAAYNHWDLLGTTFRTWGVAWEGFFFLVSGFLLTFLRLTVPPTALEDSSWAFIGKRLWAVYPAYLFALLLQIIVRILWGQWKWFHFKGMTDIFLYLLFLQPYFPAHYKLWNYPGWIVADLVICWYFFVRLFHWIRSLDEDQVTLVLKICAAIPLVPLTILGMTGDLAAIHSLPLYDGYYWLVGHHPGVYIHQFVFGMALARWYCDTHFKNDGFGTMVPSGGTPHVLVENGALYASVFLLLLFFLIPGAPQESSMFGETEMLAIFLLSRLGGLMIPMGMLVLGLAYGEDPVAQAFARPVLVKLGAFAFAMFILYAPVGTLFHRIFEEKAGFLYLVFLLVSAVATHRFIQMPLRRYNDGLDMNAPWLEPVVAALERLGVQRY